MESDKVTLKKYPNRRLYDTEKSAYVTLKDVAKMIREGREVEVIDVKTDEEVTAFILTQIIMENAKRQNSLLPTPFLHLVIRFGEDLLSEFFEKYLERAIQSYLAYRKNMDEQLRICLELGMDLSSLTERIMRDRSGFSDVFDAAGKGTGISEGDKNLKN
jgi:polyhydroxyalkanoate synthesis repressor PhaR